MLKKELQEIVNLPDAEIVTTSGVFIGKEKVFREVGLSENRKLVFSICKCGGLFYINIVEQIRHESADKWITGTQGLWLEVSNNGDIASQVYSTIEDARKLIGFNWYE